MFGFLMFSFASMALIYIARDLGNKQINESKEEGFIFPQVLLSDGYAFPVKEKFIPLGYKCNELGFPIVPDPFDVFVEFLEENGVFESYFTQIDREGPLDLDTCYPSSWLTYAFNWDKTAEGFIFWLSLSQNWYHNCLVLGFK